MNKFLFKSAEADLQKLFQLTETVQSNVLYTTHRMDFLIKEVQKLVHDKDLQTTVDKYFEEDSKPDIPDSGDLD